MVAKLIGICGTLSTGKTTLARSLASKLSIAGMTTEYATEAATDYIIQNGPPSNVHEELSILLEQIRREKSRCELKGVEFVISDCPAFLVHGYGVIFADYAKQKHRHVLIELYTIISEYINNYWKIFYIPKTQDIVPNGIRYFDEDDAIRIDKMINSLLTIYKLEHFVLDPKKPAKWVDIAFKHIKDSMK